MLPRTRVLATSADERFGRGRFLASTLRASSLAADFACQKATVDVDRM
jgi:hypothetical protein